MNQTEKELFLIKELLKERQEYCDIEIPRDSLKRKSLLRSLINLREPSRISEDFLSVQDSYLKEEINNRGITDVEDLTPISDGIYLWQGNITTLRCDAIVNAANSQMEGCYFPCHSCVDNCIHTFSGVQLRLYCSELMAKQGSSEPIGKAKITPGYNLPCKYIIHTVGPTVNGNPTKNDCKKLEECYISCLNTAVKNKLRSIAFCCISTGEFHFPNEKAAEIAVKTVINFKKEYNSKIKVIFNVFKDKDLQIYQKLSREYFKS